LTLVLARAVLVRPAEVAGHDGAVHGAYDLAQGDLLGRTRQDVSSAHSPLGAYKPGTFQREKDLLQVRLRETGAVGDVADRGRAPDVGVQG
jgi:hypothetical protein